jgi:hypothetical protein
VAGDTCKRVKYGIIQSRCVTDIELLSGAIL